MSFFGMLGMSSRSMEAARFGLDVTGQNLANVNTPGYSRRVADFAAVPPPPGSTSAGGGVEVRGLRAQRDRLFDLRLYRELPHAQREQAIVESLQVVEVALGEAGASLDARLTGFFDAWSDLAEAPTSATARAQVLAEGEALAASFRNMSERLDAAANEADRGVRTTVDEINALTSQIAALNAKIGSAISEEGTLHLRDERGLALERLASLTDIQTVEEADGTIQVSFGNGQPLVVGETALPVTIVNEPVTGDALVSAGGVDITGRIQGGRLAGLLHTRDTLLPAYQADLDTLAYGLVQEVNARHDAGFTLAGADAPPFFQPLGSSAGAASAIGMNAAVVNDPSLIAAGGVAGTPGDNQMARSLADLRDGRVLAGGTATFADTWSQLVYRVGQDGFAAGLEADSRNEVVRQIENLRDSVSGVSLDEEAAAMMRFQRAYEANARFFNTVNETLDVLMGLGR